MAGGGSVKETSAQIALAQHAQLLMDDYKARWLPVQQQAAAQIESMGKAGSWQRTEAAGKASTDAAIQFGAAQDKLESTLTNRGAAPGSSRFNLGVSNLGANESRSSGIGQMVSEQQIDSAYTQGLGALAAIGRGQSAGVTQSMEQQAANSGKQAAADAQAALMGEEAIGGAVGTAAGYGLSQFRPTPPVGVGSNPLGYNGTQNNPSAFVTGP